MKKVVWFSLVCALLILGAMVFDYLYNDRFHRVEFHTVSLTDFQEKTEFSAPILQENGLSFITGAVPIGRGIDENSSVVVTVGNTRLDGYLYRLEPAFEDVALATVSVVSPPPDTLSATATLYGELRRDLIFVPPECIITDERGKDAVFVEVNGYAVLRNVETGKLKAGKGREILSGVFPNERLIISPKNIRTGDRISS